MKRFLVAAAVLAVTPFALAQGMSEPGRVHKGTGVVKSADAKNKSVTLAHEPIASMNWGSMTMVFKADDAKLVEKLKPGTKVEFEFTQKGSDYVITSVK